MNLIKAEKVSVALVSSSVGTTHESLVYSFVFDEAHKLGMNGLNIHVIRSFYESPSFSHGVQFHGIEKAPRFNFIQILLKHLYTTSNPCFITPPKSLFQISNYAHTVAKVVKPLIVTVHGYDILVEPNVNYGARLNTRIDAVIRKVLKGADIIMAASAAAYNEVNAIVTDPNKIYLVPNGVDTERFKPNLDSSLIKKKLCVEGYPIIFALRSHEPKYGLEYLIKAASIVAKEDREVVFVIGGDGSLKNYHKELANNLGLKDKIIFTGKIPQNEVPYYYAMSDVVVVPSVQEAFGLVVSEGMACGKPVIGTAVGGIPDQIIDGYNGFLVQPCDYLEIAKKILWLIKNPEKMRHMGLNGRKLVKDKFDINDRVRKVINLYEKLKADYS